MDLLLPFLYLLALLSYYGTHKHIPDLIEPPERKNNSFTKVLKEVKETTSFKWNLYVFIFSGLLAALAGGIEAAFAVYFDSYFWGLNLDEMLTRGLCLYLSPIIAIFAAFLYR